MEVPYRTANIKIKGDLVKRRRLRLATPSK